MRKRLAWSVRVANTASPIVNCQNPAGAKTFRKPRTHGTYCPPQPMPHTSPPRRAASPAQTSALRYLSTILRQIPVVMTGIC